MFSRNTPKCAPAPKPVCKPEPVICKPTPPPICKPTPAPVVCKPPKNDCRDDRNDRDNDRGGKDCGPKKPNIWDCDNGFWGKPHCSTPVCTTVEKPHTFTGNTFPGGNLVDGQAISGSTLAALGQIASNMAINADTTIKGQVTFESADFHNTLGAFTIKADGTIMATTIVVENTDGGGGTFELDAGAGAKKVGFFLAADGAGGIGDLDLVSGSLRFVTNFGTPAAAATKVTDDGNNVRLIYTDSEGNESIVQTSIWFTSDRGGSNSLNYDGMVHTISGVDPTDPKSLVIAFEDKPSLYSDKDYNDAIFKVTMTDEVKVCCDPKPSCDPTPCKPVIDFCDAITKAIADFVHNGADNNKFAGNDNGHSTAAGIFGIAGAGSQPEDQSAYTNG